MSRLTGERIVTEMDYKENLAYLLKDDQDFVVTEYKVLTAQGDNGYVPCMKLSYNGKIQLFYLTRSLKRLSDMFYSLDSNHLSQLICSVLTAFLNVKNNGFLKFENTEISFDKIFIDSTLRVSLIYLPVSESAYPSEEAAENVLRSTLIKYIDTLSSPSKEALLIRGMCADGNLTLEDVVARTGSKSHLSQISTAPEKKEEKEQSEKKEQKIRSLTLVSSKDRRSIVMSKPEFLIGKNAAQVDYVITANNTISRIHCKLLRTDDGYAVMDMKSSNGTFLNGKRLAPEIPAKLHNGDSLRLSNVDFSVVM